MRSSMVLVIAALGAAWAALPAHAREGTEGLEQDIRTRTLDRAAKRADAMIRDPALHDIAGAHSKAMYRQQTLAHVLKDHNGPERRVACGDRSLFGLVSENVGYLEHWPPKTDLARQFVEAWMNSPPHRRNILAAYQALEVGCHGDDAIMYCTQIFARSVHYLANAVPARIAPGDRFTLRLTGGQHAATEGWRVSLAKVSGDAEPNPVPLDDDSVSLTAPQAAGAYRLNLWIPEAGESRRFVVIGGPYLRVGSGEQQSGPCSAGS